MAADQSQSDPQALAFANMMAPEVQCALDAIPEEFRSALLLVDVQELSYQEVSAVLLVPVGTVKSRVSRGRALLREALLEFARDRGIIRS
jgi:RNA polymerase sigma-70 factor (ECF subfamily)